LQIRNRFGESFRAAQINVRNRRKCGRQRRQKTAISRPVEAAFYRRFDQAITTSRGVPGRQIATINARRGFAMLRVTVRAAVMQNPTQIHAAMTDAPSSLFSAPLRTLLRSIGQIVLQPSAVTGACFLAAWLVTEPLLAGAALLGALVANANAVLARMPDADTSVGLHGFNGALAGLAAVSFTASPVTALVVTILAASATAWLLKPWSRWLSARGLGFYSSPCLIVTWLWLPVLARVARQASPAPAYPLDAMHYADGVLASISQTGFTSGVEQTRFTSGVFAGIAQTGFTSGALAGILVLLGIAIASRRHALYALIGAVFASTAHLLLGASASEFIDGLAGFNGTLTALALADAGLVPALCGVALSVLLHVVAMYFGWPAMTAPFVLATWTIQTLRNRVAGARPSRLE
jgi:urea transporter